MRDKQTQFVGLVHVATKVVVPHILEDFATVPVDNHGNKLERFVAPDAGIVVR